MIGVRTPAWLKDHLAEILRTVGLALLGAVGVILSPIRDALEDWVRPEWVSIKLQAPNEVTQGHVLDVSFVVFPRSSTGVSGGLLQFSWEPENSLQPISLIKSIPVQQMKQPSELPAIPWRLRADRIGNVTLKVTFLNRKAQLVSVEKHITVLPAGSNQSPSDANYTGRWQININFATRVFHGQLDIQDENYDLIGRYRLSSGERGHLSGRHDGGKLWLELETSGSGEVWHLESPAPKATEDGFLATNGTCSLLVKGHLASQSSKAVGTFSIDASRLAPPQR